MAIHIYFSIICHTQMYFIYFTLTTHICFVFIVSNSMLIVKYGLMKLLLTFFQSQSFTFCILWNMKLLLICLPFSHFYCADKCSWGYMIPCEKGRRGEDIKHIVRYTSNTTLLVGYINTFTQKVLFVHVHRLLEITSSFEVILWCLG